MLPVLIATLLTACASNGAQPDSVEANEPVLPSEMPDRDYVNELLADCLIDKGWPVTFTPGPGNGIHLDSNDPLTQEAKRQDLDRCLDQLIVEGIVPHPDRPLSDEYWRGIYDENIEMHECLQTGGYSVPDIVSFDTFLEMRNEDHMLWDPFSELYPLSETEGEDTLVAAFEACLESRT